MKAQCAAAKSRVSLDTLYIYIYIYFVSYIHTKSKTATIPASAAFGMDKMMTSSERFLKNDKLCVSIEILLAKHTYTYIHNARNENFI